MIGLSLEIGAAAAIFNPMSRRSHPFQPPSSRSGCRAAALVAAPFATLLAGMAPAAAVERVDTVGGDLSLVVGRVHGDRAELGLVIALKPGWKTYWRTPGDAGIPPRIALSGGAASDLAVAYPVPHRFGAADAPSLGYSGTVTLPMTVHLADPARPTQLAVSVKLGVCNDICVPVIEDLMVTVGGDAGGASPAVLERARRAVPVAVKPGAPLAVTSVVRADAELPAVEVEIDPGPDGPVADVFVEAGDDWALPQPTRLGDAGGRSRWRVVLADPPAGRPVDGAELTLTVVGAGHAAEQHVTVPSR
jgi:DsbC/DsbD-like thiol-disulfide interchange protein